MFIHSMERDRPVLAKRAASVLNATFASDAWHLTSACEAYIPVIYAQFSPLFFKNRTCSLQILYPRLGGRPVRNPKTMPQLEKPLSDVLAIPRVDILRHWTRLWPASEFKSNISFNVRLISVHR